MTVNGFVIDNFGVLTRYVGRSVHLTIPSNVTRIGKGAFYQSNIVSVHIPGSVVAIGEQAFRDCTKLTDVTVGEGCTEIGDFAFWSRQLPTVRRIALPATLKKIGKYAFYPHEYEYHFESDLPPCYYEIRTPYNPVVMKYAVPYVHMSVDIVLPEQEVLARFSAWQITADARAEGELTAAKRELARLRTGIAGYDERLRAANDKLKALGGIFHKRAREEQARQVRGIERDLQAAESKLPACEARVARAEQALDQFRALTSEQKLQLCRREVSKEASLRARTELYVAREEYKQAQLTKQRQEETRRYTQENPWHYIPLLDDTPLTSSNYTLPDHGPLATAANCGMPVHSDNGEMLGSQATMDGHIDVSDV